MIGNGQVTPPQDFCLYLDEIPMVRPDVAALPTDKEAGPSMRL